MVAMQLAGKAPGNPHKSGTPTSRASARKVDMEGDPVPTPRENRTHDHVDIDRYLHA